MRLYRRLTLLEKIEGKFVIIPGSCWLWIALINEDGYGRLAVLQPNDRNKWYMAHRAVYECLVGPIPFGYHLDHLCEVTICVNPFHLEPVTPAEHQRRDTAKRKPVIACPEGHPYTVENTYVNPRGAKICRCCKRRRGIDYWRRRATGSAV